jgi:GntR family transcriptional regulator
MRLRVDPSRPLPPSAQLVEGVLDALARGQLAAGEQLPTVRGLADEVVVNPNTVARAYRDLEALGVVEGRHGSGVFVTEEGPAIARRERRGATVLDLQRAVQAAVAVGHEPGDLRAAFEKALNQATRPVGGVKRGGKS